MCLPRSNISSENGIQFEIDNGQDKDKVKLKPAAVKTVGAIFDPSKPHIKKPEECIDTYMAFSFHEVEGYK